MKTNTMRQMGLAALLACGLIVFMPGSAFAQGGGGHGGGKGGGGGGGGGGRSAPARGGPGNRGGPGDQSGPNAGGDSKDGAGGPGGGKFQGMGGGDRPGWMTRDPGGSGGSGAPGTRDPGVNQRERNQEGRIGQGAKSGQLTKDELDSLKAEQKAIRQEEKQYKSDGVLTKDERKDLHQDLNQASKDIYQQKHDAETQPGVKPADPKAPGTKDPGVNQRERNQEGRIGQGVKSGQLTPEETAKLQAEQKAIREEEKQYKSDGSLTKDERKDLQQDLNQASKDIYAEKHDAETQPGVKPADPKAPGAKDPGVNQRQANQEQRIKQGVQSGELTRREAHTLAEKEAALANMEKRLKSDGSLSAEDRARLQRRLDFLSKDIAREKHDAQKQPTTSAP
jgi:hypothetical protein